MNFYLLNKDWAFRFKTFHCKVRDCIQERTTLLSPQYISQHRPKTVQNCTVHGHIHQKVTSCLSAHL